MESPWCASPRESPPLAHLILERLFEEGTPLPVAPHEETELRGNKQPAHLQSLAEPTLETVFSNVHTPPVTAPDSTLPQTGRGRGCEIPKTQSRKKEMSAEETTRAVA